MLHDSLSDYLAGVERSIRDCTEAYVERYQEEILTPRRANLQARLRFQNGNLLEISEAVVVEADLLVFLDYRYHYQDEQNRLIFRYDSTPHFPGLPGFPHHRHTPGGVSPSDKPDIRWVVQEAQS